MELKLPALALSLGALSGASLFFDTFSFLPFLLMLLVYLLWVKERFLAAGTLLITLFSALYLFSTITPIRETELKGKALLEIESIREGKRTLKLYGTVKELQTEEGALAAKNIRFTLSLAKGKEIPSKPFTVSVTAKKIDPYTLKIKLLDPLPSGGSSLPKLRFQLKKAIQEWIYSLSPTKRSGDYIGGLLTGVTSSDELSSELRRFGLQHILAISGFHFSLAALFLSTLFRLFLSERRALILLLFSLLIYTLFLGFSPSVFRAFVMASLFFTGQLLMARSSAVNNLAIALLAVIIIDPLSLLSIGLQFSFLITAALLIITPHISLEALLPKRSYKELLLLSPLGKGGAIVLSALRGALTLSLAVSTISLPLTLFHFGSFPLQSLLYNLFFPPVTALLFTLILLGILLSFTPLGAPLIALSAYGVEALLKTSYGYPPAFEFWIETPEIPLWLLVLLVSLILLSPRLIQAKREEIAGYL